MNASPPEFPKLFRRLHWAWPWLVVVQTVAQTIPYTGGTLVENFDSMGTTGTNTPPGWVAGWSGPGVTFTTNVSVSNGGVAPNQVAGWNFGTTAAADRALGLAATGSGTPTPPGTNRFLEVRIRNATTSSISAIQVRYHGEEWRTGSSSSQVNVNVLQFSADGVNFTDLGAAFQFTQPVFTPVTTALDGNAAANRVTNIGGIYALPSPVSSNGVIYLRWFDLNDPSTDPGLALDNFSFASSPIAIITPPLAQAVTPGSNATFSVVVLGPGPFSYHWRRDGVLLTNSAHIAGATSASLTISNVQAADLGAYTVTASNALGVLVSPPAGLSFIAPSFHWARQVTGAGSLNESGDGVAMDGATHLYVSGNFSTSASFGPTNVAASGSGIFLARYTAAGALEWVRTASSATAGGEAHNVAVDPLGNCYLTGSFMGTTSFGASNVVSAGGSDVFIAKYDRAGTLLWVTRQGAGFNDSGRGVAADGTNGCFVTGILQTSSDANVARDIFFARYGASGALVWQQVPTGAASDAGMAAASDADGNAYFTGWITGTVNFGATNLTAAGSLRDIFVAKYSRAGALLWVVQSGGVNADEGKGVGVDTNGHVYVGASLNLNFDGSENASQLRVLKYSGTGALLWQRDLPAEFYFFDFSSVTDLGGHTWIFAGLHGEGVISGVPVSATGAYDGLVAKYDSTGVLLWLKQIGGSGSAIGHRVAADVSGHAYLTGEFDGAASFGVTNLTGAGGTDFFLARLGSETVMPPRLGLSSSNGLATVEVTGAPGTWLQIETASALANSGWNVLTNVILPASPSRWSDESSLSQTQRFYRARLVP
jgi:hypothetical protein